MERAGRGDLRVSSDTRHSSGSGSGPGSRRVSRPPPLASPPRVDSLRLTRLGLLVVGLAAGITGGANQPAFAICCAVAALVPARTTSSWRERALLLAYAVCAWALIGLAPVITIAEPLGGPYGGHPLVFVAGLAAGIARVWALSRAR
jgi:hypothetical protein